MQMVRNLATLCLKQKQKKDLGVTVDKNPTFKNHVTHATSKANCILGVMHRTFDHITDYTFVKLYKALV